MKQLKIFLFALLLSIGVVGCSNGSNEDNTASVDEANNPESTETTDEGNDDSEKVELFISAAASLTDAFGEMEEAYEEEYDVELTFNFSGSGKLAQQIQQGAPVDVFISANENWMNTLIEEGLIKEETREDVTGNKLVLIASGDSSLDYDSFEDINGDDVDQIAVGNPESVPAGEYTEAVLKNLEKWDELKSQFVLAKDVRQVLTYVETGNADIGFVYESDAMSTDKVKILAQSDPSMHEAIIYPGAIIADTEVEEKGKEFLDFLLSDEGQAILAKHGFTK